VHLLLLSRPFWAEEEEIFALADVLSELGVGTIQSGGGRDAELDPTLTPARYMKWLIPDKIMVYRISA
jgi:hypothetical protein